MSSEPEPPVADTKDWTWAAENPCDECGFDPHGVTDTELAAAVRATTDRWRDVLARPGIGRRPAPRTWSALEYACHVRDVHRIFTERVALMLVEDDPEFANWDQDAVALEKRYWEARAAAVADEIAVAAEEVADVYDDVPSSAWLRPGRRGDGGVFTVSSIGRYHLHDVIHHLHDVGG